MNIVEYYDEKCKDPDWFKKYSQCGDKDDGSIFKCFSTNYRTISSFEYYFIEFKKLINKPRNLWPKKDTSGQEINKQYVVNMVSSFLFISQRTKDNNLIYNLTMRGNDFDEMLKLEFSEEEKRLLILIFLINASFENTPRYLLKKSLEIFDRLCQAGFTNEDIEKEIINFLTNPLNFSKRDISNIFNCNLVWLISFYSDSSFLQLYLNSTKNELKKIKEKTIVDYKNDNKRNALADKYKSTRFQRPALMDTFIIMYLSKVIKDCQIKDCSFNEFYLTLINTYAAIYKINKNKVINYIFKNENIFKVIFKNATSEEDDFTERYVPVYRPVSDKEIKTLLSEKIDSTSQEGVAKLEVVRNVLKKLAKEKSQYKCALHDTNHHYFTSKEEHKNYLEIHHLVPREFSYNFDDTIEFVENYIPLCPNCHRKIHKAEDRERRDLISHLFEQRHEELAKHNINVTIKDLYDFYKIDEENR